MKKLLALLLCAAMLCTLPVALAETTEADTFTSASVSDFYGDSALTGDALMDAINSYSGFYIVSTTNPDGSANSAYFIFACVKHEDKYYLRMGLAQNQSRENLVANGKGVAVYAAAPGDKPYATSGARMEFTVVTDADLLAALGASETSFMCEITSIKPLG